METPARSATFCIVAGSCRFNGFPEDCMVNYLYVYSVSLSNYSF